MKSKVIIALALLVSLKGNAQQKDSIPFLNKEDKLTYKQFVIPAVLINSKKRWIPTPYCFKFSTSSHKEYGYPS